MKIIIVGGGKIGYYLAKTLLDHGHEPHLIEIDHEASVRIANDLDIPVICGDGTTTDVLAEAGISSAQALISVTDKDENNLVACQLAKQLFNVKRTVAKVNNPKNAAVLKQLGVDIPISTTESIVSLLEREVDTAAVKHLMALSRGEVSLNELQIPPNYKLHGIRLSELKIPEESIIVSITRNNSLIIPRGNTQIFSGDKVLVVCKSTVTHELNQKLCLDQ